MVGLHVLAAVSALLLFLLEPLIAKAILPWFGGSAGVWTTCMLFFQGTLLGGYAYAHSTATRMSVKAQVSLHVALLVLSIALLPIAPSERWKPTDTAWPELRILGLLGETIGLPFFLLSATSPLLQVWMARARPGFSPFRLYASSNLGAFAALPAYPFLVETRLGLAAQIRAWSVAYAVFAIVLALVAIGVAKSTSGKSSGTIRSSPAVGFELAFLWIALPACSSAYLLAVTNQLCQDVAPVPFLWLVPLAIYLASLVLCFSSDRWYVRRWFVRGLVLALVAAAGRYIFSATIPLAIMVAVHGAALFVACMICHGELARLRPAPDRLTTFYLCSALGGAVGALFVGIVAPRVFADYWELLFGIAAILPLSLVAAAHDPASAFGDLRAARRTAALLGASLFATTFLAIRIAAGDVRFAARNFYGVARVVEQVHDGRRLVSLFHGITNHGSQFVDRRRRNEPTTYYGRASGVGLAFARHHSDRPRKVGIVGLGAGNLAAYGKAGDRLRFYEINPLVAEIAEHEFSFLADSEADVEVVLGDARLLLERERPQAYDLLVVDAFSSNSIPIHCITLEAFALYLGHLAPTGLLAIHVSNAYLNLEPVVAAAARAMARTAVVVDSPGEPARASLQARWILVGAEPELFGDPAIVGASRPVTEDEVRWSDDFSTLVQVLG